MTQSVKNLTRGGLTINLSFVQAPPFITKIIVDKRNKTFRYDGFCIEILKELSHQLHFRYEIVEPVDGLWGAPKEDGTGEWSGLVGMVMKGVGLM